MSDYWKYRPSKRPSVKAVKNWDVLFAESIENHWAGKNGSCYVYRGEPFPDFYKVVYVEAGSLKKTQKLFYGESAHNDVRRFVYDLGLFSVDMAIL